MTSVQLQYYNYSFNKTSISPHKIAQYQKQQQKRDTKHKALIKERVKFQCFKVDNYDARDTLLIREDTIKRPVYKRKRQAFNPHDYLLS